MIVDGQQRLTSLYAVIKGIQVVRATYEKEQIEIAFRPTDEKFDVADAAIRKDPEFIPNLSILWAKNANLFEIVGKYVDNLKCHRDADGRMLTANEIKQVQTAIQRVSSLLSYPFTALELSASLSEEQVAEVFVRINTGDQLVTWMEKTIESEFTDDFWKSAGSIAKGGQGCRRVSPLVCKEVPQK